MNLEWPHFCCDIQNRSIWKKVSDIFVTLYNYFTKVVLSTHDVTTAYQFLSTHVGNDLSLGRRERPFRALSMAGRQSQSRRRLLHVTGGSGFLPLTKIKE